MKIKHQLNYFLKKYKGPVPLVDSEWDTFSSFVCIVCFFYKTRIVLLNDNFGLVKVLLRFLSISAIN